MKRTGGKRLRFVVLAACGILAASFLLGLVHPFGDPGPYRAEGRAALLQDSTASPAVRQVLAQKCGDCHSLTTQAPVYAHLAPASWLVERDIMVGRRAMNLSNWDHYSVDQQDTFKAKIATETRKGDMPPAQYLLIHWSARLSPGEIAAIGQWAKGGAASTGNPQASPQAAGQAGDAARGKIVFEKRCTGCHALNRDRDGPHLAGVYGRAAGTAAGFDYSAQLKATHIVWSDVTLNRWLTDPQAMVPGADMDFYVRKPNERSDVIAFLKQQSGQQSGK